MKKNCIFHVLYVLSVKISSWYRRNTFRKNFRKVDFSKKILLYWWKERLVSQYEYFHMHMYLQILHFANCNASANFLLHVCHANFHLRFHSRTCNSIAYLQIVLNSETETIFASYHVLDKCISIYSYIYIFIQSYMHAYEERKKIKKRLCLYYFVEFLLFFKMISLIYYFILNIKYIYIYIYLYFTLYMYSILYIIYILSVNENNLLEFCFILYTEIFSVQLFNCSI